MSKLTFEHKIRVRYGETDKMGFVYYGNYALYLEEARTELIRSLGFSYKELEDNGIALPVVNLNINYRKPAYYDDELLLKTWIQGDISKKITFHTEIYRSNGLELLIIAEVSLVFVDTLQEKVITCPKHLKEKLIAFQCK